MLGLRLRLGLAAAFYPTAGPHSAFYPVAVGAVGYLFATRVMTSVGPLAFLYEMNVTNIALRCLCNIITLEIFMNNAVFLLFLLSTLSTIHIFFLFVYILHEIFNGFFSAGQ